MRKLASSDVVSLGEMPGVGNENTYKGNLFLFPFSSALIFKKFWVILKDKPKV